MTNLRQAAQQALEFLMTRRLGAEAVIESLNEALAQPEQEPVAWMYTSRLAGNQQYITRFQHDLTTYKADKVWALYTTPAAAQPEQEPVISAWSLREVYFDEDGEPSMHRSPPAAQRTWVGLEAEEILDLFDRNNVYGSKWIEFARTVEAKLKEKNDH
jgi:hypothetical protein